MTEPQDLSYATGAAIEAALRAEMPNTVGYLDEVTDTHPEPPYWVVWSTPGTRPRVVANRRPTRNPGAFSQLFLIHACGITPREALALADRIADTLIGLRLVVAGRKCQPIGDDVTQNNPVSAPPPERDPNLDRPVFTASNFYRVFSTPGPT